MNQRPRFLLDCDGPLSNFTAGCLKLLAQETGAEHTPDDVDQWTIRDCDFFKQAARKINIEPKHLWARIAQGIERPNFCADLEVQPGAIEAVRQLEEMGDVYVVTSPWDSSPTWQHERLHWIARTFDLPRSRVWQGADKFIIHGHVFVDDKPSHVKAWREAWPTGEAILFDMHHNRREDMRRGGWDDVFKAAQRALERMA